MTNIIKKGEEPVFNKKLTSKDEYCPKCGKKCLLDDITLHNCGWNARYCSSCGHTFYVEEEEEEE